jgi:exonuclease III
MRVMSANVNGLRAAVRKGFCDWLDTPALTPDGYHAFYESGERKWHSGVSV